jgi:hypothetical protein
MPDHHFPPNSDHVLGFGGTSLVADGGWGCSVWFAEDFSWVAGYFDL